MLTPRILFILSLMKQLTKGNHKIDKKAVLLQR